MSSKQTPESFWAKVKKGKRCWEWQGSINSTGYGTVAWKGKVYCAHRVAAWLVGLVASPQAIQDRWVPRAGRKYVLHKCDNRLCCNPDHFFVGSLGDNMKDAYRKRRKSQPQGAKHTNAKLTNKQAADIRRRYAAGETQIPLAKEYGVSQRVISLIVRGESYKCHS
jgi:hypothetical protein